MPKKEKTKYRGELAKRITPADLERLAASRTSSGSEGTDALQLLRFHRLLAVAALFGVSPVRTTEPGAAIKWFQLAWALACQHVPGMRLSQKVSGRPRQSFSDPEQYAFDTVLLSEMNKRIAAGKTARAAATSVARLSKFRHKSSETLRKRYAKLMGPNLLRGLSPPEATDPNAVLVRSRLADKTKKNLGRKP